MLQCCNFFYGHGILNNFGIYRNSDTVITAVIQEFQQHLYTVFMLYCYTQVTVMLLIYLRDITTNSVVF